MKVEFDIKVIVPEVDVIRTSDRSRTIARKVTEFLKFLFDKEQRLKLLGEDGQPVLEDIKVVGREKLSAELQYVVEEF